MSAHAGQSGQARRLPAGGLRHDPERLRLEHRAHLHADAGETLLLRCRYRLGTASNLVMYVSAADNDYVGVTGFLATPSHREAALRSFRRLDPRAGAAVGGHAGPVQHADQGLGLRGRVGLRDGPAGGLAGPHGLGHAGLTAQGNLGCDQLLQRRELHGRVHDGRGHLGRSLLRCAHSHRHRRRSHAAVHRGRVRQLAEHHGRGQRGPAELSRWNHGQHVDHQQHGQRRELHHGGRRVHGHADGLGRSNRGKLRSHRGPYAVFLSPGCVVDVWAHDSFTVLQVLQQAKAQTGTDIQGLTNDEGRELPLGSLIAHAGSRLLHAILPHGLTHYAFGGTPLDFSVNRPLSDARQVQVVPPESHRHMEMHRCRPLHS